MGAIIDGTACYGYALTEDPALPPMMLGDEEIEALVLGLREVQALGDVALASAAGTALNKTQAQLPAAQAHSFEHAVLAVASYRERPQHRSIYAHCGRPGGTRQRSPSPIQTPTARPAHAKLTRLASSGLSLITR